MQNSRYQISTILGKSGNRDTAHGLRVEEVVEEALKGMGGWGK